MQSPFRLLHCLLLLLLSLMLAGCDSAETPHERWETAIQGLYTAALSSDGRYALAGSIYHGGSLWDASRQERLYNWNHAKSDYSLLVGTAFSADGRYAATATERSIVLWETASGAPVWFWTAPGDILSLALSAHGDYAALGLANHSAVLFDIKNGGILQQFPHPDKVRSVALSANGRFLLTGSDDFSARLFDLQMQTLKHRWQYDNHVITTALSADGELAFTAAQADAAHIRDTGSGKIRQVLPVKKGSYIVGSAYTAARFSRDGQQLLTGTNNQRVALWDCQSGKRLRFWKITKRALWKPTSASVLAVAFGPGSGQYLALGSNGLGYRLQ